MEIQLFTPRFLLLIFFIIVYSFGTTIFNENRKSTINRLFILILLSSSFDNLGEFLSTLLKTSWLSEAIYRFGDITKLILPALYLHFSIIFPFRYSRIGKNKKEIFLIYLIPIFIFFAVIYLEKINISMKIMAVYQFIFMFSSMIILIEKLKQSKEYILKRKQILWVFFGFSFSFLLYSIMSFLNLHYGDTFKYSKYLFPIFLFFMLCPPVLSFNRNDIIYLIKRSLVYLIFIFLIIMFYLFVYENIIINFEKSLQFGYLPDILLIISIIITFQPFQDSIYRFTGRVLDRDWTMLEKNMLEISKNCIKIIEMELLVDMLQENIKKLFDIRFANVIIDEYSAFKKTNPDFYELLMKNELIDLSNESENTKKYFLRLEEGSEIILPLKNIDGVFGYLLLSKKNGRGLFSKREKFLLEHLAVNVSIAIYNSLLFKRSEKMNERLSSLMMELKNKEKELEKSDKLAILGSMTANIAHQMKNPLGIIKLSSEELQEHVLGEKEMELVKNIDWECKRLEKHIVSLMAFGGEKSVVTEKIMIRDFFKKALKKLIPLSIYPLMETEIKINDNIYILFDVENLFEITSNIVSNSIDACEAKGKIKIYSEILESEVKVFFENNGEPISEEKATQIFNPFFTTKKNGIGLGLSIVKQLLEKGGAKISVEALEKGTRFIMNFIGGKDEI